MDQSMKELMAEIKEVTKKQRSCNKVDEVRIMQTMLNDADFSISIYDKNKGLIGTRCPHDEAVKFAANICSGVTGIDSKSAMELSSNYEFTKKDAMFMLDNSRDFISTYVNTGRKFPLVQSETTQAVISTRHIDAKEKIVPGSKEVVKTSEYDKIICQSKCPKYNK